MLFNSLQYLVFYLTILASSWAIYRWRRGRVWLLLLASWYFYASNNHWILILLLIATGIDYVAGMQIEDARSDAQKRGWLIASLCSNLGMLAFFKYVNFFADSFQQIAGFFGVELGWVELNVLLPAGISFYTFESMSYVIDVYRGELKAERSFARYACFVAFFPHLIAGPIVRPAVFFPQLEARSGISSESLNLGFFLIFQGLFKKIVLADYLADYADAGFNSPEDANVLTAALATYAFTFQIYFDFSGYTDIAIGCSKLMGIDLPDNFRRPYVASSITDFWRRWHISLSSWLRDYLYISLGGNRMKTRFGVDRNLMITMLLGGLWHGAAWHFVLWGGLQGALLVTERRLGFGKADAGSAWGLRRWLGIFITFHLACLSWIIFRARDNATLVEFVRAFGRPATGTPLTVGMLLVAAIAMAGWASQIIGERNAGRPVLLAWPSIVRAAAYGCIAVAVTVLGSGAEKPFIYFQF